MGILKKVLFGPASAAKVTEGLKNYIIRSTLSFSRQEEVVSLLNFKNVEEGEYARMVNEMHASALVMVKLSLETIAQATEGKRQEFFREVRDGFFDSYTNHLANIGVKNEYVKIWSELLEKRREEFWQDRNEHRHELPEATKGNPWIYVAAIDGAHHIRRGGASPDDPFFKIFLHWLGGVSEDISRFLKKSVSRL